MNQKSNGFTTFMRTERGFTLIEMLVVMAITAVTGVILVMIFTNTLRGSNKSQILSAIKQNGQSVLENMDKTIRNADNVVCPSTNIQYKSLVVVKNGVYTRYRFTDPSLSSIANGLIYQDSPAKQLVAGVFPDREETDSEFVSRVCPLTDPLSAPTILTDTNIQSGVSVVNGLFARNRSAGFMDQVTIQFDITTGVGVSQSVAGQIDPVRFQTTIQLR